MPQNPAPDVDAAKTGPQAGHFEKKSSGFVEARFTARPEGDLPLDVQPRSGVEPPPSADTETTDVAELPDEASVHEAREKP